MISEFIKAFIATYKSINADKLEAKSKIKEVKELLKEYKHRFDDMTLIRDKIEQQYNFFPFPLRQDFIQETIDVLNYGYDCENQFRFGLILLYDGISSIICKNLKDMKTCYKKHEYKLVIDIYNDLCEEIESKLVRHGIRRHINNDENTTI